MAASIDTAEVARFDALAGQWWDLDGPMRALHRLNPVRVAFLRDTLCRQHGRDPQARRPLKGLRLLDIGCGAGILAEPLARLGAAVTGIDAAGEAVAAARAHAEALDLAIDYRQGAIEDLSETFDAVLAMEVVEHVADLAGFLNACTARVGPGGMMFCATLNRTWKSYALGILAAEYLLRWVPPGTHDWKRFVTPQELSATLAAAGLTVERLAGIAYDPLADRFALTDDLAVNYLVAARRAA
ncbi:MAG: bifunctional 2-polyprenyl-6-hydroxyphenol methylase/3-demethylubiquinol 3-O-methyltransferase UbiG [Thalassobaculales bacterium]